MIQFNAINRNEKGLDARNKLNTMLSELISGLEGINVLWKDFLNLKSTTDSIGSKVTESQDMFKEQLSLCFDQIDKSVEDLKSYINGMEGGVSAFAPDTSYTPDVPFEKSATILATEAGTYTNILDSNGSPITVTEENALIIFYKSQNSNYWNYKAITGITIRQAIDGGGATNNDASTKIQTRGDTLENWLKADPVLSNREIALVATNPNKATEYNARKVGNGFSKFSELPLYYNIVDRIFSGGRADSTYGGGRTINCGGADG